MAAPAPLAISVNKAVSVPLRRASALGRQEAEREEGGRGDGACTAAYHPPLRTRANLHHAAFSRDTAHLCLSRSAAKQFAAAPRAALSPAPGSAAACIAVPLAPSCAAATLCTSLHLTLPHSAWPSARLLSDILAFMFRCVKLTPISRWRINCGAWRRRLDTEQALCLPPRVPNCLLPHLIQ